jgi:hypothetical protein
MGLFDSVKKMLATPSEPVAPPEPEPAEQDDEEEITYDFAGFDPWHDEEGFFDAAQDIESTGEIGGSGRSRAQTMSQYGLRDHLHWQSVRDSVYHALAEKHGSFDVAMQRQMNHQSGRMTRMVQGNIAAKAQSGELNPVEGVSLEAWAALNAAIVQGANFGDLLKGAGIDRARWDRARSEWEARMSRDTTFAITTVYGNAFQAASQGQYGALAREANAARAANTELTSPLPITIEQYFDIVYDQSYAAAQGKSAIEALKGFGLSIVDFCDLSAFMGYYMDRHAAGKHEEYTAIMARSEARAKSKYPGVRADVDLAF